MKFCIERHFLTMVVATAAAMGVATAADMSVKAPIVPPAVFSWDGFYVGANLGGAFERSNVNSSLNPLAALPGSLPIFALAPNVGVVGGLGTGGLDSNGAVTGGVQVGYNRQIAPWALIGIEGDFSGLSSKATLTGSGVAVVGAQAGRAISLVSSVDVRELSTIRGRLGYVLDHLLIYGTGGVAFTNIQFAQSYADQLVPPGIGASSTSNERTGWTIGAGAEYALLGHWSVKAEYIFAKFPGVTTQTLLCAGSCAALSENLTGASGDVNLHVVRLGLNYRF
jgi:outer membrane immunogenic protein